MFIWAEVICYCDFVVAWAALAKRTLLKVCCMEIADNNEKRFYVQTQEFLQKMMKFSMIEGGKQP